MPAIRTCESTSCCGPGACGPVPHLRGPGAGIARHNLASEPTGELPA